MANHDIIELTNIPRERPALQAMLNEARHTRKIKRLKLWAAGNCFAWTLIILFIWPGALMPPQHGIGQQQPAVHLPIVVTEAK